jgi:TPR repeat protein
MGTWDSVLPGLKAAAAKGDQDAEIKLAFCLATGQCVDKDLAAAARWLRQAAEKRNVQAQYSLGLMVAGR